MKPSQAGSMVMRNLQDVFQPDDAKPTAGTCIDKLPRKSTADGTFEVICSDETSSCLQIMYVMLEVSHQIQVLKSL